MAKRRNADEQAPPETSPLGDDEHAPPPAPPAPSPPVVEEVDQPVVDDRVAAALAGLDKIDADIRALGNPRAAIDTAAATYSRLMAEKPGKIKTIELECSNALEAVRAAERSAAAALVTKTTLEAKRAKAVEEVRKAEAAAVHEREVMGRIAAATAA